MINIAAVLAITIFGIKAGPTAIHQARILYWQREAMSFTVPPSQIVMESGSGNRQIVAGVSPDYVTPRFLQTGASIPPPQCFLAKPWRKLYPLISGSTREPGAMLYLHERHTPGGKPRLIALDTQYGASTLTPWISASVFESGSAMSEPLRLSEVWDIGPFGLASELSKLRVYAGQSDPADPGHFTIAYQLDGVAGILDGWLDSNDQITLKSRTQTYYLPQGDTAVPAAAAIPGHAAVVQEFGPPAPRQSWSP